MSPAKAPTIEEILTELRRWDEDDGAGMTAAEMAAHFGVTATTIRKYLRPAVLDGRVKPRRVLRESVMRPGVRLEHVVYVAAGRP